MVDVAQLVERLTVTQVVTGSNPVVHPKRMWRNGRRPRLRAWCSEQERESSTLSIRTTTETRRRAADSWKAGPRATDRCVRRAQRERFSPDRPAQWCCAAGQRDDADTG